jgi:putative transposase
MARKPRVHYPGALYHAILRGNGGQTVFFDDKDCTRFCLLIQEGIERFGHRIHAFCLMRNHVHLAIQVGNISLSRILQNLSFRYARWVNRRQSRTGHLFQGRYRAIVVDADVYLKELTRYIHLNPVRAGVVDDPRDYAWSGHRGYLGVEAIPWLTTEWVLSQFSERLGAGRKAYERFALDQKEGAHQEEYHRGSEADSRILGDDTFIDQVLRREKVPRRPRVTADRVVKEICRLYSIKEEALRGRSQERQLSEARGLAAWIVMELGVCTLGELASLTGRDVTTLSAAIRRIQIRAKTERRLRTMMTSVVRAVRR